MNCQGTISFKDYLAAQWVHVRPRPFLAFLGVVLLALAVWVILRIFLTSYHHPYSTGDWIFVTALSYLSLLPIFGWYRSRKTYSQRKDLHREISFSVNENGLEVRSENAHAIKAWSDFHKWKEGKTMFLLYLSDNMFQLVPKHFFENETAVASFRAVLQAKIK